MGTEPELVRVYAPDVERQLAALERLLFGDLAGALERAASLPEPPQAAHVTGRLAAPSASQDAETR